MSTYSFTIEEDTIRNNGFYEINLWEHYKDDPNDDDKAIVDGIDGITLNELIELRDALNIFIADKML